MDEEEREDGEKRWERKRDVMWRLGDRKGLKGVGNRQKKVVLNLDIKPYKLIL